MSAFDPKRTAPRSEGIISRSMAKRSNRIGEYLFSETKRTQLRRKCVTSQGLWVTKKHALLVRELYEALAS
jgi:hypothetical protein